MSLISVVLPVYYEEELIKSSYDRLALALAPLKAQGDDYELVFIDDGSKDQSFPILKEIAASDKKVKIISFARNFGHQTAITAGMQYAKGDAVVTIDADMQDPPELIIDMVAKWREGFDVVYGVHKKRAGETIFKKFTAHVFYRFLKSMSDIDIPPDSGDFRLFSRAVCDYMNSLPERNRYIRGLMVWVGFKHTPIEFNRDERQAGETKYTLKKMLKLASDGVLGFSYKPIKMLWKKGILFAILAILSFLLIPLFTHVAKLSLSHIFLWCAVGGVAIALIGAIIELASKSKKSTIFKLGIYIMLLALFFEVLLYFIYWSQSIVLYITVVSLLFVLGVLMVCMGVLGEYLTRMMDEVRGRPQYTIKEIVNI